MRLRALLVAVALVATPVSALAAGGTKSARRLGAAYAKKRAATRPLSPPVVIVKSRAQSAGLSCRSAAKG